MATISELSVMQRKIRAQFLGVVVLASISPATAASPPQALFGKSVLVSWSESNEEQDLASNEISNYYVEASLQMYVSDKGQVFSRYSRDGGLSVSAQQIFDANGSPASNQGSPFSFEQITFDGNSFSAVRAWGAHGAQRLAISFSGGFKDCSARFVSASDATGSIEYRSRNDGRMKRATVSKVTSMACSVREGNVFG
jgi:hypothetical protein